MDFVDKYLTGLEAAIHKLSRQDVSAVVEALLVAWRADRQIFVIGNGGSAATASHRRGWDATMRPSRRMGGSTCGTPRIGPTTDLSRRTAAAPAAAGFHGRT